MSCLLSEEVRAQNRINKEIERQLTRDKKEANKEIKLLLLGMFFVVLCNLLPWSSNAVFQIGHLIVWYVRHASNFAHVLLGTGESGKSTFIKQMRIIHGGGYSNSDRLKFVVLIHRNIYTAVGQLLEAMDDLGIAYKSDIPEESLKTLAAINPDVAQEITPELKKLIGRVWEDAGIQACFSRRREFQISDSAK